eukprot:COSAG03_NODE_2789_length_2453_cov_2.898895_2_plen_189_part_00
MPGCALVRFHDGRRCSGECHRRSGPRISSLVQERSERRANGQRGGAALPAAWHRGLFLSAGGVPFCRCWSATVRASLSVSHALCLPLQVLSAVTRPSEAKFYTYGAWLYAIHAGCMDFRAAAHAACSQDEAEALLAGVYSSILRQFLIAVSELEGGHSCAMCRRARACVCVRACARARALRISVPFAH